MSRVRPPFPAPNRFSPSQSPPSGGFRPGGSIPSHHQARRFSPAARPALDRRDPRPRAGVPQSRYGDRATARGPGRGTLTKRTELAERMRLAEARDSGIPWRKWGPYLSERQWGTVREDYSDSGNAWDYFSHDQARSRAYHWGEDGLAGVSDDWQLLCLSLALWNGHDPILKERLFGLTNSEGNHGEDVKEYYFYLDSTPTHSYMKYLYKYPQSAYPYDDVVRTNKERSRTQFEYELLDTGVFDQNRYFDVFVEYAKASPEDLLIEITVHNRGPEAATLHVLPTIWFRNVWSWGQHTGARPSLKLLDTDGAVVVSHPDLGTRYLYAEGISNWLFTENDTN